jgi:hypothetical protein
MKKTNYAMRICLKSKRIILNRATITVLGKPPRLSIWYDGESNHLMLAPAEANELDAYEISVSFWNRPNAVCVISQIALFQALLLRAALKNETGGRYLYPGIHTQTDLSSIVIFDLNKGKRCD